jgi:hypothetical protein
MRTGRPRSYESRLAITTNIEEDLYTLGHDELKIPANVALTLGYIGRINSEFAVNGCKNPEDLDRFLEIQNRAFRDLVLEQKKEQDTIDRVSNIATEVRKTSDKETEEEKKAAEELKKKKAEKIEVYDRGDDTRKIISMEKYLNDPDSYEIPKKPVQEDEEDDS